ncbi:DNA mismatch repair protein MSH1, mitochondrial [Selaginella moellendorffii]|uniref:DNA mismatch repair protein MSH1, mitochondrial n=1 Tax=Selaginella moellendorffii TaxID=88036 RepID=UPI000D1CE737|nr:DNA mismatch repair protein MSH1, mitochondrial [Selaginella moellendorffii]|eukprot:XP_024540545.1 DNA mismatch repair protein MSH1, mitochondrial [Selaginella moellendorffii]
MWSALHRMRQARQDFLVASRFQSQGFSIDNASRRLSCGKLSTMSGSVVKMKRRQSYVPVDDRDKEHICWWQERMNLCQKPTTKEMIKLLIPTNLLGLDPNLRHGSLRDGSLNAELLDAKRKFPREVLLCRIGEFYEACGFDACILVEFAGLNPMGGIRANASPRAGCPIANLRQTLDNITQQGLSVCVMEEVQGAAPSKYRKDRFIAGHAHPGSPYIYGLAAAESDFEFPEPCPVVGISQSVRGYTFVSVLEMMRTYTVEDGLTEEALVTKLRSVQYQQLFLHRSLRGNSSGSVRWGSSGDGALLWAECKGKDVEWFDRDPVSFLLDKVKEMYDIEDQAEFREIARPSLKRPRPVYLGTASQAGILPVPEIPSLLKVLVPSDTTSLCVRYLRDLLLNPPPYATAAAIQECLKLMTSVKCSIPEFLCVSAAKLVKLIGAREVNHLEFSRIKHLAEDVLYMHENDSLRDIFHLLLEPTILASGLQLEAEQLVTDCKQLVDRISSVISCTGDPEQLINSYEHVPDDFFIDFESSWKGRVQRKLSEDFYADVDRNAAELNSAIVGDFLPVLARAKSLVRSCYGNGNGEICYVPDHQAVWFKGKGFMPLLWGSETPGEEEIKRLIPALDSKGKKVGDDWHTTGRVESAVMSYREAATKANFAVVKALRCLSDDVRTYLNTIIFISMFCVIAKAFFAHASEGKRRKWVFPVLGGEQEPLVFSGLLPYWLDSTQDFAIPNSFEMSSIFLLTGPNGGGKSSLLRSVCAATLLGLCGLMVPASKAVIPQLDSIMLRVVSQDSPSEGKSLFQMEMAELKTLLLETTRRSLVLVDELCKGTDVQKGTCILASVLENFDRLGCLGIVSTHLHGLLDMKLDTNNVVLKAMGTRKVLQGGLQPTWELIDGECRESLAFETAKGEGVTEEILDRARELYEEMQKKYLSQSKPMVDGNEVRHESTLDSNAAASSVPRIQGARNLKDLEQEVLRICKDQLNGTFVLSSTCYFVGARQQPPPFTSNHSCVYILHRPDGKFYVGQTDNLSGRIASHRTSMGLKQAPFLYLPVSNKSVACQLETALITQLTQQGLNLVNKVDQRHKHFGISPVEAPF